MALQRAEVLDSAYARDRAVMVERHLKARGIDDPLLLDNFLFDQLLHRSTCDAE